MHTEAASHGTPGSAFMFPTEVVVQPGGAFLVRPGRPVARLSPKELGRVFGVDRDTVYRWRSEGVIPPELIEPGGRRKFFVRVEAVELLRARFQKELAER